MSVDDEESGEKPGGKERMFIAASVAIFLAIAACVVYVVFKIV